MSEEREPTPAVQHGRLRRRLTTLAAVTHVTDPEATALRDAVAAVVALTDDHLNEMADTMFAAVAEAGRIHRVWQFRCVEPGCPVGQVTYSEEWEPEPGTPIHCPICGSAMGDAAELVEEIGGGTV